MKPAKFGAMIAMSSDDARIGDALDRLERRLRFDIENCVTATDARGLLLYLIHASESWCNLPRVDRARWLDK